MNKMYVEKFIDLIL